MKGLLISGIFCLLVGSMLSFAIYLNFIDHEHTKVKWYTYPFTALNFFIGLRNIWLYKNNWEEPITINGEEV